MHDVEAEAEVEAEALEAGAIWWKRKRKGIIMCRFRFHSVSKLLLKFW
jgi:hypothetical protein